MSCDVGNSMNREAKREGLFREKEEGIGRKKITLKEVKERGKNKLVKERKGICKGEKGKG